MATRWQPDAAPRVLVSRLPRGVRPRRTCRLLAESERHHPDIELGWGRAAFTLTTHAASGLSRNDFIIAARIDRLADG
jgi:pterin-4a-carbinolamine dehydratase